MILDRIIHSTRMRVEKAKLELSIEELKEKLDQVDIDKNSDINFPFEEALKNNKMNYICEVKKASPSKGIIAEVFDPVQIALDYELAGADCISVLTEPEFFLGSNHYLKLIKEKINIPVLRKDFIIDEYQIYESKLIGADCILLICSVLNDEELKRFHNLANKLGLSVLVEAHDEEEVKRAVKIEARMIGVNNRNLKTFEVDVNHSLKLRENVPNDILFVSESGIESGEDVKRCYDAKVNAILVGEALMRASNKKEMLGQLNKLI